MEKPIIALTQGDTNGVGLEIVVKALAPEGMCDLITPVIFANKKLMAQTISALKGENLKFYPVESAADARPGRVNLVNVGDAPISPSYGHPTPESGRAAFLSLEAACDAVLSGDVDAIVTAPISKEAIQNDDFRFPGQTEYLEAKFASEGEKARMILFNDDLRVALLTTHLPVAEVAAHVTKKNIIEAAESLNASLRRDFGLERPKIAVLSLNPHCGDGGLIGREEKEEIIPAIAELSDKGILAFGPYAADGFFANGSRRNFDGILAMYHDQGLAPFKALAGASGVNFTSGLDCVRTSPDHGTAYDIAGQWCADPASMRNAIFKACDIIRARDFFDEASENPLPTSVQKVSNKPQ